MTAIKKIYREKMNFSKAELAGSVSLGAVGISMPTMASEALESYRLGLSRQRDSLNFGMFGNDPKYYDKTQMSDILPKPEDFLEVPFRLISATIVGGMTWKATDFSNAAVLKKSVPMLDGVPLYKDHETDLDNWVGLVNGVKWTAAFKDASGLDVPAGIDGLIAIDIKTNPKVARGVAAGAIFSNSVTVDFDWEMSHTFENEYDFYNKIGTMGSDGKMIRRIVVGINDYHESSLVWLGADPFAKAIQEDGSLKNIDISSIYSYTKQSFAKTNKVTIDADDTRPENVAAEQNFSLNFAVAENVLSLARRTAIISNNNNQNNDDMNKFLTAFVLVFGSSFGLKEGDKPTEEQMLGFMKQLSFKNDDSIIVSKEQHAALETFSSKALEAFKASSEENKDATAVDAIAFMADHTFIASEALAALQAKDTEVVQLTADKTALETKITSLSAEAKIGKEFIGMKRAEAIRLYKVAVGGEEKADASVVALFEKADSPAVDGLLKQYAKEATHKFSGKCTSCGSADFEFQSSFTGKEEVQVVASEDVSAEALYARHSASSMNIGRSK